MARDREDYEFRPGPTVAQQMSAMNEAGASAVPPSGSADISSLGIRIEGGQPITPGRCATCRWAKPRGASLECASPDIGVQFSGMGGGYCDAEHWLNVSPDFGCVMYEEKA